MKYLLLGGSGFIGVNLASILAKDNEVVIVGRQEKFRPPVDSITYRQMDFVSCRDFTKYIADVDVVLHMVSTIFPSDNIDDLKKEIEDNVNPTLVLLKNAVKLRKKVVFLSSGGAIYGENSRPNKETDPTNPRSSYGVIKLIIEKYFELYHNYGDLDYRIIRLGNPYSEKVYHNKRQGVIPVVINNIQKGLVIENYGEGQTRDYIHIDDAVEGIKKVLEYEGKERIFNIGTGEGHKIDEIVKIVEKELGKKATIRKLPARKCDVENNILDISLIRRETGWSPKVSLEEGIKRSIEIKNGGAAVKGEAHV